MSDNSFVIVFPSVFAKNKLDLLVSNIKNILKVQNQKFSKITKDDSVIVIEANDPVFASSTINLLYGIERVAIAKQVKNEFDVIVSAIAKIGTNLLLSGERFLVKLHGYICIFTDKGHGGLPYNSQNEKIVCCVYDELSAVSCLETIREGFDVKIVVCFRKESDLLNLVKIVNNLIPRMLKSKIELDFFQILINGTSAQHYLLLVETVTELILSIALLNKLKRVFLAVSPL